MQREGLDVWGSKAKRRAQSERGVIAVELALVLPILLLLLFAIIDFARAYNYLNDSNHIAASGARMAAIDNNPVGPAQSLQTWMNTQGDTNELRNGSDQVTQAITSCLHFPTNAATGTAGKVGDPVRAVVTSKFKLLPIIGVGTITLRGKAIMRIERLPTKWTPDVSCPA